MRGSWLIILLSLIDQVHPEVQLLLLLLLCLEHGLVESLLFIPLLLFSLLTQVSLEALLRLLTPLHIQLILLILLLNHLHRL